ncbi:MAG: recombinase family protein [Sphingomonadales bacterium]|nr:recombinase family protein [Sphingomonadales bacterium]
MLAPLPHATLPHPKRKSQPVRTVLYARYSSSLQNSRSIEDQIALLTERCAREGWQLPQTGGDAGRRAIRG